MSENKKAEDIQKAIMDTISNTVRDNLTHAITDKDGNIIGDNRLKNEENASKLLGAIVEKRDEVLGEGQAKLQKLMMETAAAIKSKGEIVEPISDPSDPLYQFKLAKRARQLQGLRGTARAVPVKAKPAPWPPLTPKQFKQRGAEVNEMVKVIQDQAHALYKRSALGASEESKAHVFLWTNPLRANQSGQEQSKERFVFHRPPPDVMQRNLAVSYAMMAKMAVARGEPGAIITDEQLRLLEAFYAENPFSSDPSKSYVEQEEAQCASNTQMVDSNELNSKTSPAASGEVVDPFTPTFETAAKTCDVSVEFIKQIAANELKKE